MQPETCTIALHRVARNGMCHRLSFASRSLFINYSRTDRLPGPIDLQSLVDDGALTACDASEGAELDLYVDFASQIDDGEAMALAIAKSRRWTVATDDRKAIRLATEHAITVVTTPDLMKSWADNVRPTEMELQQIILRIESQATFFPASRHHLYEWWNKSAGRV